MSGSIFQIRCGNPQTWSAATKGTVVITQWQVFQHQTLSGQDLRCHNVLRFVRIFWSDPLDKVLHQKVTFTPGYDSPLVMRVWKEDHNESRLDNIKEMFQNVSNILYYVTCFGHTCSCVARLIHVMQVSCVVVRTSLNCCFPANLLESARLVLPGTHHSDCSKLSGKPAAGAPSVGPIYLQGIPGSKLRMQSLAWQVMDRGDNGDNFP